MRKPAASTIVFLVACVATHAQGVREHTRPVPNRSTSVTDSQATELTLTVTEVAVRPIQIWVRTAGLSDGPGTTVTASLSAAEGALVKVGQRVRAFPPDSRSSMFQGRVSLVASKRDGILVNVNLMKPTRLEPTRYVLEIVADRGDLLSVPNEAIIETGAKHLVYVQQSPGRFTPKEIQVGVQGELYTQVTGGVRPGEQVVTFGSFFIDADYKLKGS